MTIAKKKNQNNFGPQVQWQNWFADIKWQINIITISHFITKSLEWRSSYFWKQWNALS